MSQENKAAALLAKLLADGELHDITLTGNDGVEVSACRAVLSASSPVFKAMLLGKFAEGKSDKVEIQEYEGDVLKAVVEFIHTDESSILTNKKRTADGEAKEVAPETLKQLISIATAAQFFDLPDLNDEVLNFLRDLLPNEPSHLSLVLLEACNQAGPTISEDFMKVTWSRLRFFSDIENNSSSIHQLSRDTLEKILRHDTLGIDESNLFQLLIVWAEIDIQGRRESAMELSKHINLKMINPKILSSKVEPSEIVTKDELLEAYKFHALNSTASGLTWSNTGSNVSVCKAGGKKSGRLTCAPITSGVHTWTLQHLWCREERWSELYCGVAPNDFLDNYGADGLCGFYLSGGVVYDGVDNDSSPDFKGSRVIITLDLRPDQEDNGTFRLSILDGGTKKPDGIITNVRDLLEYYPQGFVPVLDCSHHEGFKLLDYNILQE